jgi:hypothetical protein
MTYNVQWASDGLQGIPGKSTIVLPDDFTNTTSTSISLTGRDVAAYGQIQQTNFIQMLENFASASAPNNPTVGQLWYDSSTNSLMLYSWNGVSTAWTIAGLSGVTLANLGTQLGAQPLLVDGSNSMIGPLNAGNNRIIGVANPTTASDAATKAYVDSTSSGLQIKTACAAATTTNLNATYTAGTLDTNGGHGVGATLTNAGADAAFAVDGYSAAANDRILVKNQAISIQNGIYVVTTVGDGSTPWVLTRAGDFDDSIAQTPPMVAPGAYTFIANGTTQQGSSWVVESETGSGAGGSIVIGTDPITFVQFSAAQVYTPGIGIGITGNVISNAGVTGLTAGANIQISASTGNVTISLTGTVPSATSATLAASATAVVATAFSGPAPYPLAFLNGGSVYYNNSLTYNAGTSTLTSPNFAGALTGNASTATLATTASNLASGGVGSIPYQTSSGVTTMLSAGINGQVLTLSGGVPTWQNPASGSGVVTSIVAGSGIQISGPTGAVTVSNSGVLSITGTPQQVMAINSSGNVTLSLPQSIATSSQPTFASLILGTTGISPTPTNYGSLAVGGSSGGYAGIQFTSTIGNRTFMVGTSATPISGMYNVNGASWDWFFTGGTLTQGTVPAANIGAGTASINISGNAASATSAITSTTQVTGDNTTNIATTAFVQNQIAASGSVSTAYWCYGNAANQTTSGTVNFQNAFANTPVNITSYNSGVVTVTRAGLYYVTATVTIGANAEPSSQGIGQIWIQRNGVLITGAGNNWSNYSIYNNSQQNNSVTVSGLVYCAAGDTISINFNNNTQYGYVQAGYGQFAGFKVA